MVKKIMIDSERIFLEGFDDLLGEMNGTTIDEESIGERISLGEIDD